MTRDDIIRMARESELMSEYDEASPWVEDHPITEYVERFAALVAAAEREECAKVCDERARKAPMGSDEQCEAEDCAAEIRARGGE